MLRDVGVSLLGTWSSACGGNLGVLHIRKMEVVQSRKQMWVYPVLARGVLSALALIKFVV